MLVQDNSCTTCLTGPRGQGVIEAVWRHVAGGDGRLGGDW
jgi:hypothetical protein